MLFTQEFEFCFQNFTTSLLRNSISQPSEAPLSSILQNLKKSLFFHDWIPKGLTNFECVIINFHNLNYHNAYAPKIIKSAVFEVTYLLRSITVGHLSLSSNVTKNILSNYRTQSIYHVTRSQTWNFDEQLQIRHFRRLFAPKLNFHLAMN